MSSAKQPPMQFSDLPVEIRCLIWKYSFTEERILPFRVNKASWERITYIRSFHNLPPPKLLHVCQESRKEALRFYRLGSWDVSIYGQVRRRGWWNPSMDIIYVPYWLPSRPPSPSPPGTVISTNDANRGNMNLIRGDIHFQERMATIQHLAFSTKSASIRWEWEARIKIGQSWSWSDLADWLSKFPLLKTFTLIVDYMTYRYSAQGPRWVDHLDFAIEGRWRDHSSRWDMTPSKIISGLEQCFELIKSAKNDSNWKPPRVRIVLDEEDWDECHRREERYRRRNPGSYD
ncbi:hypothetical protein OCU04_006584 [Sclerotinia nivalis]|uniref:2EXR domain-containing protein n=1 Tax=Sclerotinia nivalis TaxID=352851 RepID=A0A9X0AK21_9HELO|nr:hypothetical protein OCU04_006584 [Sclerotinia nivalis]